MWRETTKHARNLKIFREELDAFLPRKVLDFHVHILNAEAVPAGSQWNCAGHPLTQYGYDDLERDLAELYPGRETAAVCFGVPDPAYDREANNRYVAEHANRARFFPLRLFDPNESDHAALRRDLAGGRFLGIKPYLNYVRNKKAGDVEINDMLPAWAMEIAHETGKLVMLHIPRKARLADSVNQTQLVELCRRWPKARIVLAHIGRAYFLKGVVGYLEALKGIPNLWYDLAMLNNWEVLEHLFGTVPPEKVLYATDTPLALAPGKSVEINDQYTYITPAPWELAIHDREGRISYTSFVYEELRAIRKAVERLGLSPDFVRGLFWENGMRLLAPLIAAGKGR
jgi:predicted TIM-barrel fold metal-dependent hydrolase